MNQPINYNKTTAEQKAKQSCMHISWDIVYAKALGVVSSNISYGWKIPWDINCVVCHTWVFMDNISSASGPFY